jgi:hypothetical protein
MLRAAPLPETRPWQVFRTVFVICVLAISAVWFLLTTIAEMPL